MKNLGLIKDEDQVIGGTPKKNMDFIRILSNLELIEVNPENEEKIGEFYDYIFKMGLEIGIGQGKQLIIEALKDDQIDFDELMAIDASQFTNFNFEPTYITDMKESFQ